MNREEFINKILRDIRDNIWFRLHNYPGNVTILLTEPLFSMLRDNPLFERNVKGQLTLFGIEVRIVIGNDYSYFISTEEATYKHTTIDIFMRK